jgi:hypothetical protein
MGVFFLSQVNPPSALSDEHSDSLQCLRAIQYFQKKHSIPSNFLYLISLVESGRWDEKLKMLQPWPWTANVNGEAKFFNNKREMLISLKKYIASGETRIDIGCSQINYRYHKKHFSSLEQMINPHYNVGYAAQLLSKISRKTKDWSKAVGLYHSYNPIYNTVYVKKVRDRVKNSNNLQLALNSVKNNKFDMYSSANFDEKDNLANNPRANIMVYNANNKAYNGVAIH